MSRPRPRATSESAPTRYDRWSGALLDVLLPHLLEERVGTVVLLSCDDETVRAAGALGLDIDEPAPDFGRCVETRFHIGRDGSAEGTRRETAVFRAQPREPGAVPPFFGVCCALVLAASRMTSDESGGMRAHNYYERLWDVLGRHPGRPGPYDFSYVPWLFKYLAEWLEDGLGGARGRLLVEEGGPKHVGFAINQCLFRERDKEHLATFFADRVGPRRDELDLLRLLHISSDRHHLTKRAQQALATPELHGLARAALAAAFETWDGSRPDPRGGRSWLASLHLAVNRGFRLWLGAEDARVGLDLGEGRVLEDPARDRFPVGASELAELRVRGLRWGSASANGVYLPRAGDTLIFEVREDSGLVWVKAPVAEHVFVLTCDDDVQRRLAAYLHSLRQLTSLPPGWNLYERVPRGKLPPGVVDAEPAHRPAVALVGGLRLTHNGYLAGFAPRVEVGEVDEQLTVKANDNDVCLGAGATLPLDLPLGHHVVEVGDGLVRWTVHMLDRNPARTAYGRLGYPLTDRGVRLGANADEPDGPSVCGALLSEPYIGELPLMLRAREVVLITEDGVGLRQRAPASPPAWLEHVGLDARGTRWEAELSPDIVWVLSARQAVAVRPHVPAPLDGTAQAAVQRLCDGPTQGVRSLRPDDRVAAQEAFEEMATAPREQQA